MAQTSRLFVINFGSGKAALSTVGYTLYNKDNTVKQVRATAGVFELGTSTGIYAVYASIDLGFEGIILWDTGEATPRYGVEETLSQLNSIQDETDNIRLIWNSLRNQGNSYSALADKIDRLKAILEGMGDMVIGIDKKPVPSIEEIKKAVTVTVNSPINIPDNIFSGLSQELKNGISEIKDELGKMPKTQNEYAPHFSNLLGLLSKLEKTFDKNLGDKTAKISQEVRTLQSVFIKFEGLMQKMNELQGNLSSLDVNDKEIMKARKETLDEIAKVNGFLRRLTYTQDDMNILAAFGHKK